MSQFQPGFKIGLLGGGQLARMLALQGAKLGFEIHALSEKASDPVAQVVKHHHVGELHSKSVLEKFLRQVDAATFESEFMDANLLSEAQKVLSQGLRLRPSPELMSQLQDRLSQKELLIQHGLPTLPFVDVKSHKDASAFQKAHKLALVLKQRRFGYDGYGTFHAANEKELSSYFENWSRQGQTPPLIAEIRCRFKRELALSLARNPSGQIIDFPLVESKQVDSRCLWVKGPVRHAACVALLKKLKKFLNSIDYIGVIAFELFDTGRDLLINEIAPRVHNSAHYSLDAASLDQFSAHLLAVAGFSLPRVTLHNKGFAMMNLLGRSTQPARLAPVNDVHLHWYGKSENRPGRKMGHLNAVATNPEQALRLVQNAQRKFVL